MDDTRSLFEKYFDNYGAPYADIMDYINSTIVTAELPGISDPGTRGQYTTYKHDMRNDGGRVRTFKSGLQPKEQIEKSIKLTFKIKNSYLNWIALRMNALEFLTHTTDVIFLPDCYLHIFDDDDNQLIDMIYKQVTIRDISKVEFRKQDRGIVSKEFDMTLAFNDHDMIFRMDKLQNNRSDELHSYTY